MVDLRLNVEPRDKVENGESVEATKKGVLTFCRGGIYLGDGENAKPLMNSNVLGAAEEKGVLFLNIAEDSDEVNSLKSGITLQNVFRNWKRYATRNGSSGPILNDSTGLSESANWTYIESTDSIASNINSVSYTMFIGDRKTGKYNIEVSATGQDRDNDAFGIVLAAYVENEKLYTLSVIRNLDGEPLYSWALLLNFLGNHDEPYGQHRPIVNKSHIVNAFRSRNWPDGYWKIKAERDGESLRLITTDCNTDYLDSTLIEYTLPKRKPDNISEREFEMLKKLLGAPQYIGFGCYSQDIRFNLLSIQGAIDPKVIDIANGRTLSYNFSTKQWDSTPLDLNEIPKNQIISCKKTRKLFVNDGAELHRIA